MVAVVADVNVGGDGYGDDGVVYAVYGANLLNANHADNVVVVVADVLAAVVVS